MFWAINDERRERTPTPLHRIHFSFDLVLEKSEAGWIECMYEIVLGNLLAVDRTYSAAEDSKP